MSTDDYGLRNVVQKLVNLGIGEQERLLTIISMIDNGDKLFDSDREYVNKLAMEYMQYGTDRTYDNTNPPAENLQSKSVSKQQQQEAATAASNLPSSSSDIEELKQRMDRMEKAITSGQGISSKKRKGSSKKKEKLAKLFAPSTSSSKLSAGILATRLGLGFVFIWAGVQKLVSPDNINSMMQNMAGMEPSAAAMLATIIGVSEIISGIFVACGVLTRIGAGFQAVLLVLSLVVFSFELSAGPAIWKDFAMLGIVALLILYGSGKYAIDHKIHSKSSNNSTATANS